MRITRCLQLAFGAVIAGSAAHAQLYVSQYGGGTVGEYDATTGASIDLITGLSAPLGLALSGNVLFVANYGNNTVGEYNATTGAAINANFITGLSSPTGLALSGNVLFVANQTSNSGSPEFVPGTVGEYNATTGAAINASFITGLSSPSGLALSGNILYVVNGDVGPNLDTIGEYNATTGAAINATFIRLFDPTGLAVSGNILFVSNYDAATVGGGSVGEYNATTGAVINANFITGLNGPEGLAVSGNTLFVANWGEPVMAGGGSVGAYDATTGTAINANFITGLNIPTDFAVASSVGESNITSPTPGITLSDSLADFSWTAATGATAYQLSIGTTLGSTNIFSGITTGTSQIVESVPCTDTMGGPIYVELAAEVNGSFQPATDYTYTCKLGLGDFNGDGHQDLVWQNNSTGQATVQYYDGTQGVTYIGWNWLNESGEPSGWMLVGAADFDGNGVPDLVWEYLPTGQVAVNYYGGVSGAYLGWNWLNEAGLPGWTVVAVADMNNDGVPDLIWQNNTTNQVTVNYYGGTGGAVYQGWNWLNESGEPSGWVVVGAADFDGNGVPDLVWENLPTGQVAVNYYGGTGGATYLGWNWLNEGGEPGWTVVGANDFNGDGVPDLVWQNDATAQVTVNYYGGPGGATYLGWNWLTSSGYPGWKAVVPR